MIGREITDKTNNPTTKDPGGREIKLNGLIRILDLEIRRRSRIRRRYLNVLHVENTTEECAIGLSMLVFHVVQWVIRLRIIISIGSIDTTRRQGRISKINQEIVHSTSFLLFPFHLDVRF